eukprot:9480565-Pyramimonas_sp.AAC.2
MAEFMSNTVKAGGKISKLTLSTPAWVYLFEGDEDFEYLLSGCAYGFTWEAKDPERYFEVSNYVPPEHTARVTERILSEYEAGICTVTQVGHGPPNPVSGFTPPSDPRIGSYIC